MSQLVQKYYQVAGEGNNNWPNNIYSNIIDNSATTSKISIMAPPGTVVQLDAENLTSKKILIGASGIYDFDNENIIITSISFPEAEDQTTLINKLQSYLREASNEIDTLPTSTTPTENQYKNFCTEIQRLIFPGTRPDGYEDDMTLGDMTATYLATISNQVRGNTSLHDIVVNYITND